MAERKYSKLAIIYIIAFTIALLLNLAAISTTNYYANHFPYTTMANLPRNLSVVLSSMFNGYTEGIVYGNLTNFTSILHKLPQLQKAGTENYETMSALLFLAVMSLIMFDFFDKEFGNRKFNPVGALALFSSFFVSLILSQYMVSCYYYCSGGAVSGISLFQVDSAATVVIFSSLTVAAALSGFLAKKMKLSDMLGIVTICTVTYVIPLGFLTRALGLYGYTSLPLSTYAAHEFGLITFYALFIITYMFFHFYAQRWNLKSE